MTRKASPNLATNRPRKTGVLGVFAIFVCLLTLTVPGVYIYRLQQTHLRREMRYRSEALAFAARVGIGENDLLGDSYRCLIDGCQGVYWFRTEKTAQEMLELLVAADLLQPNGTNPGPIERTFSNIESRPPQSIGVGENSVTWRSGAPLDEKQFLTFVDHRNWHEIGLLGEYAAYSHRFAFVEIDSTVSQFEYRGTHFRGNVLVMYLTGLNVLLSIEE